MSSIERGPGAEIPLLGPATPRGPAGIGGWLLLVAFVQLLAAFVSPARLAYQYLDPNYLKVFGEFPLAGYGELVLNIAVVLLAWVTTVLLFRKSRHFPRFFIVEFVVGAVAPLVQTAWVAFAFSIQLGAPISEFFELEPEDIRHVALSSIGAAIWIPYTLRSKRVRNTFILGLSARDVHGEAERMETPLLLVIGAVIFMLGMSGIVLGIVLTMQRGVFNGSIVGGVVQVALALWLLRGSDVARLILALLFGLGVALCVWIAFFPGQKPIGTIVLLMLALLSAAVFWVLAFSKRFRAELEINAAKYAKPDVEAAGEG